MDTSSTCKTNKATSGLINNRNKRETKGLIYSAVRTGDGTGSIYPYCYITAETKRGQSERLDRIDWYILLVHRPNRKVWHALPWIISRIGRYGTPCHYLLAEHEGHVPRGLSADKLKADLSTYESKPKGNTSNSVVTFTLGEINTMTAQPFQDEPRNLE